MKSRATDPLLTPISQVWESVISVRLVHIRWLTVQLNAHGVKLVHSLPLVQQAVNIVPLATFQLHREQQLVPNVQMEKPAMMTLLSVVSSEDKSDFFISIQ